MADANSLRKKIHLITFILLCLNWKTNNQPKILLNCNINKNNPYVELSGRARELSFNPVILIP